MNHRSPQNPPATMKNKIDLLSAILDAEIALLKIDLITRLATKEQSNKVREWLTDLKTYFKG